MRSAIKPNSKKIRIKNLVVYELCSLNVTLFVRGDLDLRKEAQNQSNHSNQRVVGNERSNKADRLDDTQQAINDPIGEPLGVVILVIRLDRLERGIHGVQKYDEISMDQTFSVQDPTPELCSPE